MAKPEQDLTTPAKPGIPALEWIAAGIGLTLTLVIVGVIGWDAVNGTAAGQPPAVEASVARITPVATGYVVEVKLRNRSPATAASVGVEGELTSGGTALETSRAMVDYVPGRSERGAGLFFTRNPAQHTLQVRALGYADP
ncbi:hypothetical protein [Novosphingobium sp. M1R2S20]|uniref:TIGR02588 family protein n=1 Tax=Novosphingobium rhizovicinum TaxID=3228928 RepID=A0ABV3RGE1_9SPHN